MGDEVRCPECASDDVKEDKANRVWLCNDCDHVFHIGEYVRAMMKMNRLEAGWYQAAGEEV